MRDLTEDGELGAVAKADEVPAQLYACLLFTSRAKTANWDLGRSGNDLNWLLTWLYNSSFAPIYGWSCNKVVDTGQDGIEKAPALW